MASQNVTQAINRLKRDLAATQSVTADSPTGSSQDLTVSQALEGASREYEEKMKKRRLEVEQSGSYPDSTTVMKNHCLKFKRALPDDPLTVPQPNHLIRAGTFSVHLCDSCARMGRNLEPIPLDVGLAGMIVPMCRDCGLMNTRVSQNIFFGTVVKSMVDKEESRVESILLGATHLDATNK